jgi:TonB family protein
VLVLGGVIFLLLVVFLVRYLAFPARDGMPEPPHVSPGQTNPGMAKADTEPSSTKNPGSPAHPTVPQRVRLSPEVARGLLITKIMPVYPPLAQQANIQGIVVLEADIAKDGSVGSLRAVSGHPMLVPAAIDAAKQWKYKPYTLNGESVEVNTQIQVTFTLTRG